MLCEKCQTRASLKYDTNTKLPLNYYFAPYQKLFINQLVINISKTRTKIHKLTNFKFDKGAFRAKML